jgi:hypothetical protein
MKRAIHYAFLFGVIVFSSQTIFGTVIFSNLGPGGSYQAGAGQTVSGPTSFGGRLDQAFPFVSGGNFVFTELDIALTYVSGTNNAVVSIWNDLGGLPGAVLTAFITGPLPAFGGCCTLQVLTANNPVLFAAGQQYWVVAVANGSDSSLAWNRNLANASGPGATRTDSGAFTFSPSLIPGAFQVSGDVVPEPSSTILMISGLMGVGLLPRRAKRT